MGVGWRRDSDERTPVTHSHPCLSTTHSGSWIWAVGVRRRFFSMPRLSWWDTAHSSGLSGVQESTKEGILNRSCCTWWESGQTLLISLLPGLATLQEAGLENCTHPQPPPQGWVLLALLTCKGWQWGRGYEIFSLHDYDTSERLSCGIFFFFFTSLLEITSICWLDRGQDFFFTLRKHFPLYLGDKWDYYFLSFLNGFQCHLSRLVFFKNLFLIF